MSSSIDNKNESHAEISALAGVKQMTAYEISIEGEYATFCVDHGERAGSNWVRIIVDSSFGAAAYTWSNIGMADWREFFARISVDSLSTKLFGERANAIDCAATMEEIALGLERELNSIRKDGLANAGPRGQYLRGLREAIKTAKHYVHTLSDARSIVCLLEDSFPDDGGFSDDSDIVREYCENSVNQYERKKISPMAQGLCVQLWPHFVACIQKEAPVNGEQDRSIASVRPRG